MIDPESRKTGAAPLDREIPDDELADVTAGRKAGEQQKEFPSDPPGAIETVVGWIRSLFR